MKLSKCKNKLCRKPFQKSGFISWCSYDCAVVIAMEKLAQKKTKQEKKERKIIKEKKELCKPLKDHLKSTEKVINEYVRERDRYEKCISCSKQASWDGVWHASHYKSVGSNSKLRFNLWNINKACLQCNHFLAGNISEYEKGLINKIGKEKVEWLKCQNGVKKYTPEYLLRLSVIYKKKTKRLIKFRNK